MAYIGHVSLCHDDIASDHHLSLISSPNKISINFFLQVKYTSFLKISLKEKHQNSLLPLQHLNSLPDLAWEYEPADRLCRHFPG